MRTWFSFFWTAVITVIAAAETGPMPMPDVDNWDAVLAEIHLPSELLLGDGAGGENPRIVRARAFLEVSGTLATNPPAMFAALSEAADLAARAGDADLALTALESMGRAFVVPDLAYRMREAVQSATRAIGQRLDSAAPLARAQLRLAEHWVASTNFQAAAASVRAAGELAARIRDAELAGEAAAAGLRVTHARELHSARVALSLNPRDPPANLTVGRHLCYRERNWAEGLPHMARGANGTLALAARGDLKAVENGGEDALKAAADQWWALSLQERDRDDRASMQLRSAQLYAAVIKGVSAAESKRLKHRIDMATNNGAIPLPPLTEPEPEAPLEMPVAEIEAVPLPDIPGPVGGERFLAPGISNPEEILAFLRAESGGTPTAGAREILAMAPSVVTNSEALYVVLSAAASIAGREGEMDVALFALDHLAAHFDISDMADRKMQILEDAHRAARDRPDRAPSIADGFLRISLDHLSGGAWTSAQKAWTTARSMLDGTDAPALAAASEWIGRRVDAERRRAETSAALAASPNDPSLNLAMGRLLCVVFRDWGEGAAHLSRTGQPMLHLASLKDRAARESQNSTDVREAADAWWNAAAAERDHEFRSAMQVRAAGLYRRGFPALSVAEQRRVKTRIDAAYADDLRRIKPEHAAGLSAVMAWLNRAPGLAISISGTGAVVVPGDARVRVFDPLAEFTFTELHASSTRLAGLDFLRDQPLIQLHIYNTSVRDLRPLERLPIMGMNIGACPVADLSPVATLHEMTLFHAARTQVTDFSPLRNLALNNLCLDGTQVGDEELVWLADLPLKTLYLYQTRITSLAPLKGKDLGFLSITETAVSDLSPLDGMPLHTLYLQNMTRTIKDYSPVFRSATLRHLWIDGPAPEQMDALRMMKLETLNGLPAAEALKAVNP